MRDETTRFSYGSTEIFHFQGCSAFSVWLSACASALMIVQNGSS